MQPNPFLYGLPLKAKNLIDRDGDLEARVGRMSRRRDPPHACVAHSVPISRSAYGAIRFALASYAC